MKEEELTHRTRLKRAMCDEENKFYSEYRSTFEKQFPTDSGVQTGSKWIFKRSNAVIRFYMRLGKSPGGNLY